MITLSDLRTMVPVFKSRNVPVLLRIPSVHFQSTAKALDLNVNGIIVPMVSTAAEAEAVVAAAKFPPLGKRGIGGPCATDQYGDMSRRLSEGVHRRRFNRDPQNFLQQLENQWDEVCVR